MNRKTKLTLTIILTITLYSFSQKVDCGLGQVNSKVFSDSKDNKLYIYSSNIDINEKNYYDSEFYISDNDSICDFYTVKNNYKVQILSDTLNIYEHHNLCIKENFECAIYEISKTSYFFKKKNLTKKKTNLIPTDYDISLEDKKDIYETIDNIERLNTDDDITTYLKNINFFIKKLEALAIIGDLKSFLKLIEFNQLQNPEISYASQKATRIILELIYEKRENEIPKELYMHLIYGLDLCND